MVISLFGVARLIEQSMLITTSTFLALLNEK